MISCTYLMLPTNCLCIYLSVNHCIVLFSNFTKDSVFWVVCYYGTRYTISPYAKQPGKSESFVTTVVCCNEGLNTIWIGFLFHKNNKNQIALSNDTVVRIKYTSQGNSLNLIILGESDDQARIISSGCYILQKVRVQRNLRVIVMSMVTWKGVISSTE